MKRILVALLIALAFGAQAQTLVKPLNGGTGVSNPNAATLTRSGAHALTLTTTGTTSLTLPTAGTLAILGANTFTAAQTVGGILSVTDATDATSATAASLKTAGGISSVKAAWIGGKSTLIGNVGIGIAAITTAGLVIQPSTLVSTTQFGIVSQPIFTSAATTAGKGTTSLVQFADGGGITYARATAFEIQNAFKYGAGDTITDNIGLDILAMTSGGTLNIGLRTVTTAGTGKWNIYASGTASNLFSGPVFADSRVDRSSAATLTLGGTATSLTIGAATVTPASTGTRYLCISTTGVVTSSATACSGT